MTMLTDLGTERSRDPRKTGKNEKSTRRGEAWSTKMPLNVEKPLEQEETNLCKEDRDRDMSHPSAPNPTLHNKISSSEK